jgi:predicted chitinase
MVMALGSSRRSSRDVEREFTVSSGSSRNERGRKGMLFSAIIMYIARKGHEVTMKELIENPPFSESTIKKYSGRRSLPDRKDKKYLGG